MKKAGILIMTMLLVAAMFTGCRRRNPDTTNTTVKPTTGTTATTKAPKPSTTAPAPSATGVIPDATDLMPDTTKGTDMGRGRMGPRY